MRSTNDQAAALVEEVADRVHPPVAGVDGLVVGTFLRRYWGGVPAADLVHREPADLEGAAISHLRAALRRPRGSAIVRVYTPAADDGWHSLHSAVDCVADDMPFIVDSLAMEIARRGLGVHLLVHPVLPVARDADGQLRGIEEGAPKESFVHVEIDRLGTPAQMDELRAALERSLASVRSVVADWGAMVARAHGLAGELVAAPAAPSPDDASEVAHLLRWLADDRFTFLAYREYELSPDGSQILSIDGTGLGLLRDAAPSAHALADLRQEAAALVRGDQLLQITKTNTESPVHRATTMDYIGVKRLDPVSGRMREYRFIGLLTHRAQREDVDEIPVVRQNVAEVLSRTAFYPGSHDASRLLAILEDLPRDELFALTVDELAATALGILQLRERPDVRLFVRRDAFGRFASCLLYVPRDRFNTEVRLRIQSILMQAFGGTSCTFTLDLSSNAHARLRVVVRRPPDAPFPDDLDALEKRLERTTRNWTDELERSLVERLGEDRGLALLARWQGAFPASYREAVTPTAAVDDIAALESLGSDDLRVHLGATPGERGELRLRMYRSGTPLSLSDVLPVLKDLGADVLDERPFELHPADGGDWWAYDFGIVLPGESHRDPAGRRRFEEAFLAVWLRQAESDALGRLVPLAGLTWREVAVLRAYRQYLRQTASPFSEGYYDATLTQHPRAAQLLVARFAARFDPDSRDEAVESQRREEFDALVADVASLDEDRILRSFGSVLDATVRTNAFQLGDGGTAPGHLVFKLDPRTVPDLPAPRPRHEIFVSSPDTEGVHLRMGPVARGGLRASDRREDYRTEILGLVKAQTVKNSVIVPVGAKGGFVTRRGADEAGVLRSYKTFVRGLLDVTDNLVDGQVVPPPRVVRHDADDTYLVVAADKGTARFSDVANEIAVERRFWLGDAFASGGSVGYDHKAMGITARGAWESVRRHFRELAVEVDHETITVVGIGDMSGDVFGNGMLLSRNLALIAAFDHRHVFLDPDPDPDQSWAERKRLYDLPGSSWDDYDRSLISTGGGVYSRRAKSVVLSDEVRQRLAVEDTALAPNELIRAVLRAPASLLWVGGIGTYVKASTETQEDAADRVNDAVRVDAVELRCRVIAEGGNLGLTQRARVEFARRGGLVNTDAIDNSAGVDCSDHEVNIKILLDRIVAAGDLTAKQRNRLLAEMTDEVAALVLADNYAQNVALAAARAQAPSMVDVHARHLGWLERAAGLDRALESLPSDDELAERAASGEGLTQPELAVLLAHTKIHLAHEVLHSDLPDDPEFAAELAAYFPAAIREHYADRIPQHPLRREIVATQIANRLVNRAGISMSHRLQEETSASISDIARAHTVAWRMFELDEMWSRLEALDGVVHARVQTSALLDVKKLGERATRWLLRNRRTPLDIRGTIGELGDGVRATTALLTELVPEATRAELDLAVERLTKDGLPGPLAESIAMLPLAVTSLDISDLAARDHHTTARVAAVYFLIDEVLGLGWLRHQITALPRSDRWQSLARSALRDDFFAEHKALVAVALERADDDVEPRVLVDAWSRHHRGLVGRWLRLAADIRTSSSPALAQLSVALREFRNLTHQTSG
jgi:glutamate dehydrogenase